ncbi:MAG: type III pantothenate kinase [Mycoplasma sp.]
MKTIYCDIGNTNIKFMACNDKKISYHIIPTKDKKYFKNGFWNNLPSWLTNDQEIRLVICSVLPEIYSKIILETKKISNILEIVNLNRENINIRICTDNPHQVGTDLLVLGFFVAHQVNSGIIVNMGTATTISFIKDKEFYGTVIAPGLMMSLEALTKNASQLKKIDISMCEKFIGKNTIESVSIGVINGHALMIKALVDNIASDVPVYLSGGNAFYVRKLLPQYIYVEQATLNGMKTIDENNIQKISN